MWEETQVNRSRNMVTQIQILNSGSPSAAAVQMFLRQMFGVQVVTNGVFHRCKLNCSTICIFHSCSCRVSSFPPCTANRLEIWFPDANDQINDNTDEDGETRDAQPPLCWFAFPGFSFIRCLFLFTSQNIKARPYGKLCRVVNEYWIGSGTVGI